MLQRLTAAGLLVLGMASACLAQGPTTPAQPGPDSWKAFEMSEPEQGVRLLPNRNEGAAIERIFVHLRNPSGDAQRDRSYTDQIAEAFQIHAGGVFSVVISDLALRRVQHLPFVKSAEYQIYQAANQGRVILALLVTLQPDQGREEKSPLPARGILVNGNWRQFPTLYENDRALLKTIVNAGTGLFSDTHSWFEASEDFVAGNYQPKGTITWPEAYLEAGLGGISQVADLPLYVYGAASYLESASLAPDIFRADTRWYGDIEKLYAGFLAARKGFPVTYSLSAGRQNFQLNSNFLFGQVLGSANALERGASFLNARTAYDNAALSVLRVGDFVLEAFYLDPDELPLSESNTRFKGINLKFNQNQTLEAALAWINVPRSDSLYVFPDGQTQDRSGLQVLNPRLLINNPLGMEGLWLEGEYAHEWNDRFPMNAQAGYVATGYAINSLQLRPQLRYRFAGFSGDDPNTPTYERFDSLRGGGLGDWLQGINLAKVYGNSNLLSHWLELELNPSRTLQFSLNYFYLFADQLNNIGARPVFSQLQSRDIGQELMIVTRWSATRNLFILGVTSLALPGTAIREAVSGPTQPWYTFQVSLFLGF